MRVSLLRRRGGGALGGVTMTGVCDYEILIRINRYLK